MIKKERNILTRRNNVQGNRRNQEGLIEKLWSRVRFWESKKSKKDERIREKQARDGASRLLAEDAIFLEACFLSRFGNSDQRAIDRGLNCRNGEGTP